MAAGKIVDASASVSSEARRRHAKERRKAKGDGRWVREVKGILALALAGFALVALYAFDPMRHPLDQSSPVGPVGLWMGWAAFWAFGYAGYVFPLLLILYGAGAFVHAPLARGWPGVAGLVLLLVSATGMLARASDTLAELRIHKGGMLGWAVNQALSFSIGSVGTWIILLAILPVAALFITQASLGKAGRALRERWTAWRTGTGSTNRLDHGQHAKGHVDSKDEIDVAPVERAFTPPPLIVKEPAKPKSTLAEKGLAWQETFDFGSGGAQSFQLPPVGLLQAPPASALKRTREELEANAATLKKKLADFGVDGHIVQASPGPVITSYEFEPAAGVKVSQVVNLSDDLALAMKAAAVRIIGPIPGRGTVAVEVPNPESATVYLREILVSPEFVEAKGRLPLALGKDTTGNAMVSDLASMPHLLIAGSTGSGKSVGLNTMICSLLYKATPADVRFLLIDPSGSSWASTRASRISRPRRHRRQGSRDAAQVDRREDGRALQAAPGQGGAQHRGLQQGSGPGGAAAVLGGGRRRAGGPHDGLRGRGAELAGAPRPDRARGRHPFDRGDPAPVRGRGDRPHQGQLPHAHRLPGRLQG
jgi:S-DNA-T family DNA segregation ATPase FtsK/SpoIIIE